MIGNSCERLSIVWPLARYGFSHTLALHFRQVNVGLCVIV